MNEILITQTKCNAFRVTLNVDSDQAELYIRKYSSEFDTTPSHTFSFQSETYDYTDLEDSVYIVKVVDLANLIFGKPTIYYIPLFVYCGIQNCMNSFANSILCDSECAPCEECEGQDKSVYQNKLYEIDKISALFWMIIGYINWEKVQYFNVYDWTEARCILVDKIGLLIERIYQIASRCSSCNDEEDV